MSRHTFKCGHPRSAENCKPNSRGSVSCRTCHNAHHRAWCAKKKLSQDPATRAAYRRRAYLPHQLLAARAKVRALENEARRYGMTELLEGDQ